MNIHWIQHVPFEKLGNIEEWIASNNHQLSCTKQFNGDPLPDLKDIDFLIVMGGPMSVYDTDKYSWLDDELQFIKSAIAHNKAVLGICLGSQFIAASAGAKVYPGSMKEIGWFPIQIHDYFTSDVISFFSNNPTVFHWHGDTFDLPDNAELLASTNEVKNQAYMIGNKVIGLQFHLEQTQETVKEMLLYCGEELTSGGQKVQSSQSIIDNKLNFEANKKAMFGILDYLSSKASH
ncbi:amidotransferase [Labilibacter sediminis]|nr:amidotransferase [Labilibacter sediminis]